MHESRRIGVRTSSRVRYYVERRDLLADEQEPVVGEPLADKPADAEDATVGTAVQHREAMAGAV